MISSSLITNFGDPQSGDRRDSIKTHRKNQNTLDTSPVKSLRIILDLLKQFSRQPRVDSGMYRYSFIYQQLEFTSDREPTLNG